MSFYGSHEPGRQTIETNRSAQKGQACDNLSVNW